MRDLLPSLIIGIGIVALVAVLTLLSVCLNAMTLQFVWQWFIMPNYNVVMIPFEAAAGIGFIASLLSYNASDAKALQDDGDEDSLVKLIVGTVIRPLMILALAGFVALVL